MFIDQTFSDRFWWNELVHGPLREWVDRCVSTLNEQGYADRTTVIYLRGLAHFSYWMKGQAIDVGDLRSALIQQFLHEHIPSCSCPFGLRSVLTDTRAALHIFLQHLPAKQIVEPVRARLVAQELDRYDEYLLSVCGNAPQTCARRRGDVGLFLEHCFGTTTPVTSGITGTQIESFLAKASSRLRPASLRILCSGLRSYFRFRALKGDTTQALSSLLPRIAQWQHTTVPKWLTDSQVAAFLDAFDCSNPLELRDYAIARCLLDLALRGDEVTHLTLDSIDWRRGVLNIERNKSRRVQQLPLPTQTGEALVRYLQFGRPQTDDRRLFVRHRAPIGRPLGVPAIRNAMNRAFTRCGLREEFCNTHVLRRTTATRLQRAGASVKEIADLLRHRSLDTVRTYTRVDLAALRAIAQPWPGER